MAVASGSENAISVSISGESPRSSSDLSSMNRPSLQTRQSLSSRMMTNDETNKELRNSNSSQRLSHIKKRTTSLGKKSDSYQKTDSNIESFNRSWTADGFDEPKSQSDPRRGVRRRRSLNDEFRVLYQAATDSVGNPQSPDELSEGHFFVPNTLSSPTFAHKSPGTSVSSASKASEKSSNSGDLLTRAAAVAGRKQRRHLATGTARRSASSSSDLATPARVPQGQRLSAPQPGYSSTPHLTARSDHSRSQSSRRQSDPTVDFSAFSNKFLNNSVTSTPRTAGMNRRRSRRLIPNETVIQDSNEEQNDGDRRKDLFRSDFPGEPIPSDAILLRLYGNANLPPPPPPSTQNRTILPILSPEDLAKTSDASFTSETEWKAWNDSVEKSRRKRNGNANDETSRRSESSKSKCSMTSHRKSSSSPKLADAGDRSYSHSHTGSRTQGHKTRHSSKSKSDASKRRDGSSHGSEYGSPRSKSRKKAETMKIRSKSNHKKSDEVSSHNSDYEAFQALLDLSNGSFFDSCDDFNEFKTSESLGLLTSSMPRTNSAPKMNATFNDSVNSFGSFAEGDEKTDKDRKKKRRGKRGDQEGKPRSRSADENRTTSSKSSRRGKRSSKTKTSKSDPKFNDSKNSVAAPWFDDTDSILFDSSLRGPQWTSNSERGPDRGGKQYKSPKLITRKNSCPENGMKQRKSPKFVSKKEMHSGSPGSLSTRKRTKKPSSSRSNTLGSQSSGELDEQGSTNSRSMKHSVSKNALQEGNDEDDGCYDFPLSPWGDKPAETGRITAEEIVAAAKHILSSPRIELKSVGKSRWDAEPSPMVNAISPMSPRSEDSDAPRGARYEIMPIPAVDEPAPQPPPPTMPPKSEHKKLDFPLNFVEYQDVSPLTVASKKVERNMELMTAINYLEA